MSCGFQRSNRNEMARPGRHGERAGFVKSRRKSGSGARRLNDINLRRWCIAPRNGIERSAGADGVAPQELMNPLCQNQISNGVKSIGDCLKGGGKLNTFNCCESL